MARHGAFDVGQTPVDLDKVVPRPGPVTRRVRCPHCNYRCTVKGVAGQMLFIRCTSCERATQVIVPATNEA